MTIKIDPEICAAKASVFRILGDPPTDEEPIQRKREYADRATLALAPRRRLPMKTLDWSAGGVRARSCFPGTHSERHILYIHGGGWFSGNLETHDHIMRRLATVSNSVVSGVDYRLAPEFPYPAALQDCLAVWRHISSRNSNAGIFGDSAGANLALAVAVNEYRAQRRTPDSMALFYGCFSGQRNFDSHDAFGDGRFGLSLARLDWYWKNYLASIDGRPPSPSAPLEQIGTALPPVFIGCAGLDVLRDESRHLHRLVEKLGGKTCYREWPSAPHGFLRFCELSEIASDALKDAALWLRENEGEPQNSDTTAIATITSPP